MRYGPVLVAMLLSSCGPRAWRLLPDDRLIPPGRDEAARSSRDEHSRFYGPYESDAHVNLLPGMRVKVVAPVVAGGESLKTEATIPGAPGAVSVRTNVTGFETSYYSVSPWRFESGEVVIGGERRPLAIPEASRIEVPAQGRPLRLLFQRRESREDRSIALLAAASIEDLDREGAYTPIAVGRGVAVSPEIAITVNGSRRWVALGTRVGSVVRDAGLVATIELRRTWRGKLAPVRFDRSSRVVLGMILNGGDELTFTQRGPGTIPGTT